MEDGSEEAFEAFSKASSMAEVVFEEALAISDSTVGRNHHQSLECLSWLAASLLVVLDEAQPLAREAAVTACRVLGLKNFVTLHAVGTCALLFAKRELLDSRERSEAQALHAECVRLHRAALTDVHPLTVRATGSLAELLEGRSRWVEAVPLRREALQTYRIMLGDDADETIAASHGYGVALEAALDCSAMADSEFLHRELVSVRRRALGDSHADTLTAIDKHLTVLVALGHWADAEPLCREVVAARRRTLGHAEGTLAAMELHACTLRILGRWDEAEPLCREVVATRRAELDEEKMLVAIDSHATTLGFLERWDEVEPLRREVLAARRRMGNDAATISAVESHAAVLSCLRRWDEAEPLCRELLTAHRRALGDSHVETLDAIECHADALVGLKTLPEAELLRRELVAARRATLSDSHEDTVDAMVGHAHVLVKLKRWDAAETLRREVLAHRLRTVGVHDPATREANDALKRVRFLKAREGGDSDSESELDSDY